MNRDRGTAREIIVLTDAELDLVFGGVTLNFTKIETSYVPQDEAGSVKKPNP